MTSRSVVFAETGRAPRSVPSAAIEKAEERLGFSDALVAVRRMTPRKQIQTWST